MTMPEDVPLRAMSVLSAAEELFSKGPDWVVFFREIMGISGLIRRTFPDPEEAEWFLHSAGYRRIQEMLSELRFVQEAPREKTKTITIRVPSSLHESLLSEAKVRKLSLNQLCVTKLLLLIDQGKGE